MPNSKGKAKATVNPKTKEKLECDCEGGSQGKSDSVLAVVSLVFNPASLSLILCALDGTVGLCFRATGQLA